jgi:hypothetical protein
MILGHYTENEVAPSISPVGNSPNDMVNRLTCSEEIPVALYHTLTISPEEEGTSCPSYFMHVP